MKKYSKEEHSSKNKNSVSEAHPPITNFQDFKAEMLTTIMSFLKYTDMFTLALVSKTLHHKIRDEILTNADSTLWFIRREIKNFFASTIEFHELYEHDHNIAIHKANLKDLYTALMILGQRITSRYEEAFDMIMPYVEKHNCWEAKFLLTQLIRLNKKQGLEQLASMTLKAFNYAVEFHDNYPDLLNGLTLAHYYFLLDIEHNRAPLVANTESFDQQWTDRLKESLKSLLEQDSTKNNMQPLPPIPLQGIPPHVRAPVNHYVLSVPIAQNGPMHPANPFPQGQIPPHLQTNVTFMNLLQQQRRRNQNRAGHHIENIVLADKLKTEVISLVYSALNTISPQLKASIENLNPQMAWNYVTALCSPGGHLLILQLQKHNLLDDLLKFCTIQIQEMASADTRWLFDTYQQESFTQIVTLSECQTSKKQQKHLDLQFIDKTIKDYVKNQLPKPSLKDLWLMKPVLSKSIYAKDADLMKAMKSKNANQVALKINDLELDAKRKERFLSLTKIIKSTYALDLTHKDFLNDAKTTKLLNYLEKFPIFTTLRMTRDLVNLLLETEEKILTEVVACIKARQYENKLTFHNLKFLINVHDSANEAEDAGLVEKVLKKLPDGIAAVSTFKTNTTLFYLLALGGESPWFEMLDYIQITTINSRTLHILDSYSYEIQRYVVTKLLEMYKERDFKPTTAEVKGLAVVHQTEIISNSASTDGAGAESNGEVLSEEQSEILSEEVPQSESEIIPVYMDNPNVQKLVATLVKQNQILQTTVLKKEKEIINLYQRIASLEGQLAEQKTSEQVSEKETPKVTTSKDTDRPPIPRIKFFCSAKPKTTETPKEEQQEKFSQKPKTTETPQEKQQEKFMQKRKTPETPQEEQQGKMRRTTQGNGVEHKPDTEQESKDSDSLRM